MAASVIGALRVTLGLDSGPFAQGTRQAMGSLARLQGSLKAISATMAAVGGAAFLMVSQTAQAANEVARQSQVANTSAEQFQRMAAGARTVGVEQEKLANILKDVNERVGEFLQTGGGPMQDFFDNVAPQVGVTADMFRDLSGADALQLYVSTLERAGLSQQDMTFYMEQMAGDATALLPLLANNGAELDRLGDAAQASGVVMSESLIAKSGEFRSALNGLRDGITGIRNEVAEQLMPIFTSLVITITDNVLPVVRDIIAVVGEWVTAFQGLPGPIQEAVGVVAAILGAAGPLMLAVAAVRVAFLGLVAASGPIGLFIAAAATIVTVWTVWGDDIKAAIGGAIDWIGDKFEWLMGKVDAVINAALRAKDALVEMFTLGETAPGAMGGDAGGGFNPMGDFDPGAGGGLGGALGDGIVEGLNNSRVEERAGEVFEGVTNTAYGTWEINSPSRVFQRIGQWISEGLGLGIRDGAAGVGLAMSDVVDTTTDAVADVAAELSRLEGSAREAFKGLVQGTMTWREALGSVVSTLADMVLNSAFQGLFGGLFQTGGAVGGLLSFLGIGARAEGGPVTAGMPYLVGEMGPELFVPRMSGAIVANHDLDGPGGASHVYLHVPAGVSEGQAADIAGRVAVSIVSDYDSLMPSRVAAISADPRKR